MRLKKEIQEKKMIQSKLDLLQAQADALEKQYKEKFGMNPPKLPRQVVKPVPFSAHPSSQSQQTQQAKDLVPRTPKQQQ